MNVNDILFQAHSGIRWLVVLALLFVVLRFATGLMTRSDYDSLARNLFMAFVVVLTLQWVLGLVYFLVNGLTAGNLLFKAGYRIPHLLVMTAVVGLSHAVQNRWADEPDGVQYRNKLIASVIAAILIFVGVLLLPGGINRWLMG